MGSDEYQNRITEFCFRSSFHHDPLTPPTPSLWEPFFDQEVADLWEPWMRAVDELLQDDGLLSAVYEAQGKRHKQSRTSGRHQTPAEVALRMLILKHVRNWSYRDAGTGSPR